MMRGSQHGKSLGISVYNVWVLAYQLQIFESVQMSIDNKKPQKKREISFLMGAFCTQVKKFTWGMKSES